MTRCSSARHIPALLQRADSILCQTLGDVVGTPLTVKQWDQARLPQRHGGLGIASPLELAPVGRLATVVDFVLRARKTLLLQPEVPLIPLDFQEVVSQAQSCLGPEFAPLKDWASSPDLVARGGGCS